MKLPGITSINKTEDSLLALAASDTVDSLYYSCTLKFNIDGSTYIVNRYLEFGAFEGFSANTFEELIKVELSIEEVLPYAIYTKLDIEKKRTRTNNLYGSWRTGNVNLTPCKQLKFEFKKNKELLFIDFPWNFIYIDWELK